MNIGDLITGVDRRYERSIYKVVDINDNKIMALPVSLGGYVFEDTDNIKPMPIGTVDEFRAAHIEEIKLSSIGPIQWSIRETWLKENYGITFGNTLPITLHPR